MPLLAAGLSDLLRDFPDDAGLLVYHDVDFRYCILLTHYWKSSSFLTDGIMLYTIRLMAAMTMKIRIPMVAASL